MTSTFTYEGISASDFARQHNGNVYNTNTNNYTIHQQRADQASASHDKSKAILKAAREGQTQRVNILLQLGAERDYADAQGWTALHHASIGGFEDLVDLLITKHGLDVNAVSSHGTPLCLAALKARSNIVTMLLKHRAAPNATGGLLGSALHAACYSGNGNVVTALLNAGAATETAVTISIPVKSLGLISARGLDLPILANSIEWRVVGCRPLHVATSNSNHDAIEALGKGAANFKATAGLHDATNMFRSATVSTFWFCTTAVCAEALLRNGGDVNWQGQHPGRSALMLAVRRSSDVALVRILIENGALLDAQDGLGNTALHGAASLNRSAQARLLIQSGADSRIRNRSGQTPLEVTRAIAGTPTETAIILAEAESGKEETRDQGDHNQTETLAVDGEEQERSAPSKRSPTREAPPPADAEPRLRRFIVDGLREKGISTLQMEEHRTLIDRTLRGRKNGGLTTYIAIRSVAKEIRRRDAAATAGAPRHRVQNVIVTRDHQAQS